MSEARPVTFDVAFVCTGNRYRSVLAEAAFRAAVDGLPVRVRSFGTLDVGPAPPLPSAVEAARSLGLDISAHLARCVLGADLTETALVLGFERSHTEAAVTDAGARPERTFVLPELVALLEGVDLEQDTDSIARARRTIERAHALRGSGPRSGWGVEIDDPVAQPPVRQREIGREVHLAATRAAELLFGVR